MRTEVVALPWPPSANTSKNKGKGGRFFSTPELKTFQLIAVLKIRREFCQYPIMRPPYEVHLEFHPPKTYRVWDAANFEKHVVDAMVKGGLIKDDNKIVRMVLEKHRPWKKGVVMAIVKEVDWDPKEWGGKDGV